MVKVNRFPLIEEFQRASKAFTLALQLFKGPGNHSRLFPGRVSCICCHRASHLDRRKAIASYISTPLRFLLLPRLCPTLTMIICTTSFLGFHHQPVRPPLGFFWSSPAHPRHSAILFLGVWPVKFGSYVSARVNFSMACTLMYVSGSLCFDHRG
jgi:hypothetical protein